MAKKKKSEGMTREAFLKQMADRYGPKIEIDKEVYSVVCKTLKAERKKIEKKKGKDNGKRAKS